MKRTEKKKNVSELKNMGIRKTYSETKKLIFVWRMVAVAMLFVLLTYAYEVVNYVRMTQILVVLALAFLTYLFVEHKKIASARELRIIFMITILMFLVFLLADTGLTVKLLLLYISLIAFSISFEEFIFNCFQVDK